jgi:hypothetical protein
VLAAAVIRFAMAADPALPDNRSTNSGKPLVFRQINAAALDRDDLDAASQAANLNAATGDELRGSSDQTGLLTQMHLATESNVAGHSRQPRLAAAAPNVLDAAPAGSTTDAALPTEPLPIGPPPVPPVKKGGPSEPLADNGPSELVEPRPDSYPSDRAPSPPHGDLPGGIWPHDYLRNELAEPLVGASWCNEPYHVDWFLGVIRGTEIITNRVDQNVGVVGGLRLGWDYDLYWGLETRLGFSSLEDEPENAPLAGSADKVILWDSSLLYYPWGDSRWRPYVSWGFGLAEFNFTDDLDQTHRRNLLAMPFGFGLKYRLHDWLTLRADVIDNLAFGSSGLATMNNVSFTTGMEFRFGGCHKNYWPWEPATAH